MAGSQNLPIPPDSRQMTNTPGQFPDKDMPAMGKTKLISSRHRVTLKKRYRLLLTQQPGTWTDSTSYSLIASLAGRVRANISYLAN